MLFPNQKTTKTKRLGGTPRKLTPSAVWIFVNARRRVHGHRHVVVVGGRTHPVGLHRGFLRHLPGQRRAYQRQRFPRTRGRLQHAVASLQQCKRRNVHADRMGQTCGGRGSVRRLRFAGTRAPSPCTVAALRTVRTGNPLALLCTRTKPFRRLFNPDERTTEVRDRCTTYRGLYAKATARKTFERTTEVGARARSEDRSLSLPCKSAGTATGLGERKTVNTKPKDNNRHGFIFGFVHHNAPRSQRK